MAPGPQRTRAQCVCRQHGADKEQNSHRGRFQETGCRAPLPSTPAAGGLPGRGPVPPPGRGPGMAPGAAGSGPEKEERGRQEGRQEGGMGRPGPRPAWSARPERRPVLATLLLDPSISPWGTLALWGSSGKTLVDPATKGRREMETGLGLLGARTRAEGPPQPGPPGLLWGSEALQLWGRGVGVGRALGAVTLSDCSQTRPPSGLWTGFHFLRIVRRWLSPFRGATGSQPTRPLLPRPLPESGPRGHSIQAQM